MTLLNAIAGLGIFVCGVSIGFLLATREVETALKLLKDAKAYHDEVRTMLQRLQEQTRK